MKKPPVKRKTPTPATSRVSPPDDEGGNQTELAYRVLRRAILDAALPPGMPLRPNTLREVYGIGWTPLREALARLENERLVTMQRNCGFTVAPVSLEALQDLTRARKALELAMLPDAIRLGDVAWEEALVLAHYRLKSSALQPGDWSEANFSLWLERHQAFHRSLLSGCASPWLLHLYGQIMDQEHRHYCVMMFLPSLREAAAAGPSAPPTPSLRALLDAMDIQHHTDLMDAALSRDVARATTLITEHVNYKAEVFSLSHVPVRGSPPLLAT